MITKKKICLVGFVVIAVNVLVIIGILHYTSEKSKKEHEQVVLQESLEENTVTDENFELSEEMTPDSADETDLSGLYTADPAVSYEYVYTSLLVGEYVAEDGTAFKFSPDNSYSGYFNEEVQDAEYYTYEIVNEDETKNSLVIYSPDRRSEVKYSLDLTMDGDVVLAIPDTETKFVLCYDGMLYKGDKPKKAESTEVTEETASQDEKTDEEAEQSEESAEEDKDES